MEFTPLERRMLRYASKSCEHPRLIRGTAIFMLAMGLLSGGSQMFFAVRDYEGQLLDAKGALGLATLVIMAFASFFMFWSLTAYSLINKLNEADAARTKIDTRHGTQAMASS